MISSTSTPSRVAIACGGTGGHLFPGLAIAEQLRIRGCAVTVLISPKEIDREAIKTARGVEIATLPAVGLQNRNYMAFAASFLKSLYASQRMFSRQKPAAVLAMGGFTSAPPVLVAREMGARTFLHDSNTVPGKANRWLARFADQCFVGFEQAAGRLKNRHVTVTGTPVRTQFQPRDAEACRKALGLEPGRPVLLVMGGSQGASGINELVFKTLPLLAKAAPQMQLVHLTGPKDAERARQAAAAVSLPAAVHPFFAEMELALGAATVAISRSGASSLAELAAMRLPAVLIPYPAATDNHQYFNARAFEETGAARMMLQQEATPEMLSRAVLELAEPGAARDKTQAALAQWHRPHAAEEIAEKIFRT